MTINEKAANLIDEWSKEFGWYQTSKRFDSPLITELIELGPSVTDVILVKMKEGIKYLEYVLEKLYGVNPVPKSAYGNHTLVVLAWETFINEIKTKSSE